MKVLLILAFALAVAGTALAFGYTGVSVAASSPHPSEPAALLLSGGALLAVASAVRRYTV